MAEVEPPLRLPRSGRIGAPGRAAASARRFRVVAGTPAQPRTPPSGRRPRRQRGVRARSPVSTPAAGRRPPGVHVLHDQEE